MEDIISRLPDDVLVSIITRIWTEEAVRTSILSKRWRNLYKFVSSIRFSCRCYMRPGSIPPHDSNEVVDVLHRFLQLHSGHIRSFSCNCCLTDSHAHIFEQCIHSLGKLGIKSLFLGFSCKPFHQDHSFSSNLLSHMPSLKFCELVTCTLQPNLKSRCNSLKTLILTDVKLLPGSLECILSNCLSLYSLIFDSCNFPSKLCFRGPNLELKSLVIRGASGVKEIEFCASHLTTFKLFNLKMVNFSFDYVPQLESVYLRSSDYFSNENVISYAFERLGKDLHHLKFLCLDAEGDLNQESSIPVNSYMFSNLTRLALNLSCKNQINLLSLTPVLHSCPQLQEFDLGTALSEYNGPQMEKHVILHSQLRIVGISGFCATKNEFDFVLYILKSAVELQQLFISNHGWRSSKRRWNKKTHKNIQRQLKDQAVSTTVQVIAQEYPRPKRNQIIEDLGRENPYIVF